MKIGFIGAGFMGYGIALNLMQSGHLLRVMANRKRDNIEKLVSRGTTEARNYNDLLVGAEAVVSCVGTTDQIENIVTKSKPHLEKSALWIACTTSRPQTAAATSIRLKKIRVDFVDAPVTRGPKDALTGRLSPLSVQISLSLKRFGRWLRVIRNRSPTSALPDPPCRSNC